MIESLALNPGQRIGPFEIVSLLGRGGMGEVFLATDTRLDRKVAIKFLAVPSAAEPGPLRRFEQEAKALAALAHPNILVVHDVGTYEGRPYLVSEFLAGKTLCDYIKGARLGLEEVLAFGIQITEGLGAAHIKGILHRDLKPANIFVTETGQLKLLDFGLSKLLQAEGLSTAATVAEQTLLTSPGTVMGTVAYMSPEQAMGQELDARSDLFSLGVVLYEMSTGRRPFEGATSAAVFNSILNREPEPPSQFNPKLPVQFDPILAKALEKDRSLRYQTAADLRADLKRLKRDSESGRLQVPNSRAGAAEKPKPVGLWLGAIAAAALVGGSATAWWFLSGQRFERKAGERASLSVPSIPFTSLPGEERHPALSPDGKQIAFAWNAGQGVDWHLYVKQLGVEHPLPLTTNAGVVYSPAWSPDGLEIAFYRQSGTESGIYVVKALPSPVRKLCALELDRLQTHAFIDEHMASRVLDWSPDGESIVFAHTNGLALLSVRTLEVRTGLTRPGGQFSDVSPVFSPDGTTIAFARLGSQAGEIFTLAREGGEPKQLTWDRRRIWGLAWSSGGQELIFSSTRTGTFRLWRIPVIGGEPKMVAGTEDYSVSPTFSRNSNRLAFELVQRNVNIWQAELSNSDGVRDSSRPLIRTSYRATLPKISPQGDKISYTSDQTGASEIWICDRNGANHQQLTRFGGPFIGVSRWSPDGREIVFPSRKEGHSDLFIISVASGNVRQLTTEPSNEWIPSWSGDGQWIYFSSDRDEKPDVYKVPAAGGPWVRLTRDGSESLFESADARWVYYVNREGKLAKAESNGSLQEEVVGVVPGLRVLFPMWDMSKSGLYFFNSSSFPARIERFEFATGQIRPVLDLGIHLHDAGLAVSPDEGWILYTRVDYLNSDIRLMEDFR